MGGGATMIGQDRRIPDVDFDHAVPSLMNLLVWLPGGRRAEIVLVGNGGRLTRAESVAATQLGAGVVGPRGDRAA